MDEKLETAEKKILVEIVKLVQKRGLEGTQGGWKDFLRSYDKKFGASLSDPSWRTNDVLVSFLKTFTKKDDLKLFSIVLQSHSNRNIVEQFRKQSWDIESPEQSLVRLTLEHPQYLLDYAFPTVDEGWIVTKPPKKSQAMKSNAMIAVDCEMVLCEDGTEALVRVCAVDRDLQIKIDQLVKPNKAVSDYRTEITGVAAGDLDGVTCSVADIQKSMKKLLSGGTISVGHSLHNDLQDARVIDTSYIFKYSDAPILRKPSLNNLCRSVLGYEVRKPGAAHNCLDDACAAMKLVLAKLERGEITLALDAPEPEREKLLLHKVPVNVRREEISRIIPGAVAIEPKPSKKLQGRHYSAFAVFNSPPEASQAYENMDGEEEKDSSGLPQKLVNFQFGNGKNASIYIRKMAQDHSHREVWSNKRAFEGEEKLIKSKRLKTDEETAHDNSLTEVPSNERAKESTESTEVETDEKIAEEKIAEETKENSNQPDEHLKEMERLKQELKEKDAKIVLQEKMISNLVKKVDEMKKGLNRKK